MWYFLVLKFNVSKGIIIQLTVIFTLLLLTVELLLYCFKCSLQDSIISNNRRIYPSNSRHLKRFGDQLPFFFHHLSCLHHPVRYLLLEVFLIFLPCQQIQRQIHKWFRILSISACKAYWQSHRGLKLANKAAWNHTMGYTIVIIFFSIFSLVCVRSCPA